MLPHRESYTDTAADVRDENAAPFRRRKKIVLCFDGTGNKFSGTDSDSNILKIYRLLDRNNGFDKHYYQPGIGTYVATSSLSHTSLRSRISSWYQKAKDSAVGTSFDSHVMGAYKFLMQTYEDDDIFIFGFSRGAYVARFLATMLDHVGLLSAGNEEMARFAWKAFARWQQRQDGTEEDAKKKLEMFSYLQAFRETFSRPVRRIRFLGLFDTVNSVPQFENAWMQRSKFPYSVRSSAKVVRHAVSIDERRAKFRSDLISGKGPGGESPDQHHHHHHHHHHHPKHRNGELNGGNSTQNARPAERPSDRYRRPSRVRHSLPTGEPRSQPGKVDDGNGLLKPRLSSPNGSQWRPHSFVSSTGSIVSQPAMPPQRLCEDDDDLDEAAKQDLEELWFPGCHADIGGGWPISAGEELPLSHSPLVWMVREAERAGLNFDREMMVKLKCGEDFQRDWEDVDHLALAGEPRIPTFQVTDSTNPEVTGSTNPDLFNGPHSEKPTPGWARGFEPEASQETEFHKSLRLAGTGGHLHDCLKFKNGLSAMSVISWKMMEYLPFRRMDLKPDGSWAAISFPLPMSEPRDIPYDAKIHHSAIRRMEANENYRPGNLIIGGGGRGVAVAPEKHGTGEWEIFKNHGDPISEVWIRKGQLKKPNQESLHV